MRKSIKLSIASLIIMYLTSIGFVAYAEDIQRNLIVKTEPLEKDTIVMVILNYNENDKVAVALAESNSYLQELTIPANEISIDSFSVSCPDGDITPNYKVTGSLENNEYILSVEKIADNKPKKIEVGHSYDGSSEQANTEATEKVDVNFLAEVPEEFIGDIVLYLKDSTDSSISFVLNYPNYASVEKVAIGNLHLEDIKIRGVDAEYKATAQDKIKVEADTGTEYLVTVEKANSESVEKKESTGIIVFQILSLILVIILLMASVYLYKIKKIDKR